MFGICLITDRKGDVLMKIVHIAPSAPYNNNWGYQENLLPKYQAKLGHDVVLIITNRMHSNGMIVETDEADYRLPDSVRVIRRKWKKYPIKILTNVCSCLPVMELLKELHPDLIFYHGLISTTILDVVKYKKKWNNSCVIVQDNHLDYNIARKDSDIKGRIIRLFYRMIVKKTLPEIERVYGVTPWRQLFAQEYCKIPAAKTDVLIMGADDEKIDFAHKMEIREDIRNRFNILPEEYLIVTGGKIDAAKKIHLLMEAVNQLNKVRLIVFGEINEKMLEKINNLKSNMIDLIGWIPADKAYDYFLAADLICFPGQHSVLWEQACACKIPCLFSRWEGMEHVDNGGNSAFIDDVSVEGIRSKIQELLFTDEYYKMKAVAESEKTDIYLYSNIAKKSLETLVQKKVYSQNSNG